jgi:hypothetical protein
MSNIDIDDIITKKEPCNTFFAMRIPEDMKRKAETICKKKQTSLSLLIRSLLKSIIAEEEAKTGIEI